MKLFKIDKNLYYAKIFKQNKFALLGVNIQSFILDLYSTFSMNLFQIEMPHFIFIKSFLIRFSYLGYMVFMDKRGGLKR